MATVPSRVSDRICSSLKRFQPVLASAKARDVNESDTSIIVTDLLHDLFGYDKYSEVTSEHAIRGTFCDLALSMEGKVQLLVEIKAIGLELKDAYVKQAIDYAANKGVDWVLLTNGAIWRVYRVSFSKPIEQELVAEFNLMTLNPKEEEQIGLLYLLTKEGWVRQVLEDYHQQRQALSRFFLGAVVLSEPVVALVRRELRRLFPDVKIQSEQVQSVLLHEVLKREVVEGDKADEARKKINRAASKGARKAAVEEPEAQPISGSAREISPAVMQQPAGPPATQIGI
jgi:predicted type IV restriction endonuclease